ncbi:MAG: hypothetical protein HRT86_05860 [Ilumatobacteraceae bacterium]|nr:hypothetical protein [Ilumatobacteraceae bacterium]
MDESEMVAFSLDYNAKGKAPAKTVKECIPVLLRALDGLGCEVMYVADATYFKSLTGCKKADPNYGYVIKCKWDGFEHINVVLGTNYGSLFHNPLNIPKLEASLKCLASHVGGYYKEPGEGIIEHAEYPKTYDEIKAFLDSLMDHPEITADFEAFSLKHYDSGLGTVGFAWDEHNGGAFCIDYLPLEEPLPIRNDKGVEVGIRYGKQIKNTKIRGLLRKFLEGYKGKIIWHNISYDATIAVYNLWMNHLLDRPGLVTGLYHMTKNFDCTKIMSYVATNSCTGNDLGLKAQGQEFAGNYAEDEIHDIRRIPESQLLEYNLVDCLTTWFTRNKNRPIMIADDQEEVYEGILKRTARTIIEMQLTGMPMIPERVQEVKGILQDRADVALANLMGVPELQGFIHSNIKDKIAEDNEKLKTKKRTYAEAAKKCKFNPGSTTQLAKLFYVHMGLPVLDYTKTKKPACGAKTIKKLLNHTSNPAYLKILESIRAFAKVEKILNTFIPAFEKAIDGGDGRVYLFGSFNLGGTFTGRLSSSGPNMQNLPASGEIGKLIKSCFAAPDGWLFGGADFASLEDYVSALTTKDPNKLKVYLDGYDGHCLRAYSYFKDQMPDIVNTVESINSIKTKYPKLRKLSKVPTFLLTYDGTYHGLMNSLGLEEGVAKSIEANYHRLYEHSDKWKRAKIKQATVDGYVIVAFGLRVRTPILARTILNTSSTPYEAQAEVRKAGNALGQSYGLLNCRAANEFFDRVRNSPYINDVKIACQIHDAIYLIWRDVMEVTQWVNQNLTECMAWQDLPELEHDKVKLHAELDVFAPHWGNGITLLPGDNMDQIFDKCVDGYNDYMDEAA